MPNLKDLKIRIESVKSTRKITKAMQMVAAAKLRRAQESAECARPYADQMDLVMKKLTDGLSAKDADSKLVSGTGKNDVHLLLVATSERGLCGGFNSSIVKFVKSYISDLTRLGKRFKLVTIGKKGREQLKREFGGHMIDHVDLSGVKNLSYKDAHSIMKDLLTRYSDDEFDVAKIFFNRFQSVMSQIPTSTQLIPTVVETNTGKDNSEYYEFEPDKVEILEDLLPRSITTQIFTALLENGASEQGARMSAMDNATRNAGEMIDKLTIQYNRSRQAAITNELIEIISGAEAL
jgi:F-type H+-transporting ATPase subunit gamma